MVAVIWALVAATLAIAVVVVESIAGFHRASSSAISPNVLWFIIPPLVVVAAMVHFRQRSAKPLSYGGIFKAGLLSIFATSVAMAATWAAVTQVLMPEYAVILSAQRHVAFSNTGATEQEALGQALLASKMFSMPIVMVLGFILPFVSGTIAAAVAALGLRRSESADLTTEA